MNRTTTYLAIAGAILALAIVAYLVSRPRVPAGGAGAGAGADAGAGTAGQRSDTERATAAVGAGLAGAGDVISALA